MCFLWPSLSHDALPQLWKPAAVVAQLARHILYAEWHCCPTKPIPRELPRVTERTTQLIGVENGKTNKMMDTKARQ